MKKLTSLTAGRRAALAARPRHRPMRRRKPQDKVTLMLNWYLYSEHAPFFLGKERGYYADEGIDLDIQEGRGSAVTAQAVAAKSATFGYIDVTDHDQGRRQGRAAEVDRRAVPGEPDVGHGLHREEHQDAEGHRRQDRGGDAGRLDVADVAAVPEGQRHHGRTSSRSSRATRRPSSMP